jgi:hypothetical protein
MIRSHCRGDRKLVKLRAAGNYITKLLKAACLSWVPSAFKLKCPNLNPRVSKFVFKEAAELTRVWRF